VTVETQTKSDIIQIKAGGQLALNPDLLSSADLTEGDYVFVLPLKPGVIYLHKVASPDPLSREDLSALMRTAFEQSGYTTREQVLTLVRESKNELAEEW